MKFFLKRPLKAASKNFKDCLQEAGGAARFLGVNIESTSRITACLVTVAVLLTTWASAFGQAISSSRR